MCLRNPKKVGIDVCIGYSVQIKNKNDRYRGIYHGRFFCGLEEQKASNLSKKPKDAGFYGFKRLQDAMFFASREKRAHFYYEGLDEIVVVKCVFRKVFETGEPLICPRNGNKLRAFRAQYRTIISEVPINEE